MTSYYELKHLIGFEETNLIGNVYYVNYFRWQGRCREMFLKDAAPEVLVEIQDGLKLFTLRCECEFLAEVTAFDEISMRMHLVEITQTQVEFGFDYVLLGRDTEVLIARGRQRVACMRTTDGVTVPTRVPAALARALGPYGQVARTGAGLPA